MRGFGVLGNDKAISLNRTIKIGVKENGTAHQKK